MCMQRDRIPVTAAWGPPRSGNAGLRQLRQNRRHLFPQRLCAGTVFLFFAAFLGEPPGFFPRLLLASFVV